MTLPSPAPPCVSWSPDSLPLCFLSHLTLSLCYPGDLAQSGHPLDSVPEAQSFRSGGIWEKEVPHNPPALPWSWEGLLPLVVIDCYLFLPVSAVLPLPHHRVPATVGCWCPGLRLLRQGSIGSLETC
jgi:hypothetical protein